MKKYLNLIISVAVSALTFIFFALPALAGEYGTINGYEFINFEAGVDYVTFFSIFGLVQLILCAIMFVIALLELLKKLNVLKLQLNLSIALKNSLYIAACCTLICLISAIIAASNMATVGIGAGTILTTIIYILAVVLTLIFKDEN